MSDFITNKVSGDTLGSSEWNQLAELDNLVASSGQTPSTGDLNQISKGVAVYANQGGYTTDSGVADAYVLTTPSPLKAQPITTLAVGTIVECRVGNSNTGGACTINYNGHGIKSVKLEDGTTDPEPNDISSERDTRFRWDGTVWRISGRSVDLIPYPNYTVDPRFELWPEGTSITNSSGSDFYGSLRFGGNCGSGGSPSMTISQQSFTLGQTDVAGEPKYFLRLAQTAAATSTQPYGFFKIEEVRTNADGSITVSCDMKAGASINVDIDYVQYFGSGGSPSSSVTVTSQSQALTTSWGRVEKTFSLASISGKTLGSNNDDYLMLRIKLPLSATNTVDIAMLKQENGSKATVMAYVNTLDEYLKGRYSKSYKLTVPPGTSDFAGSIAESAADAGGGGLISGTRFDVPMRNAPTVTIYQPNATSTTNLVYENTTGTSKAVTAASNVGNFGFRSITASGGVLTSGEIYSYHYTADGRP